MRGIEVANYVQSLFAIHSAFNLFGFAVKVLQPVRARTKIFCFAVI